MEINQQQLADLLKEAKEAHHEYEQNQNTDAADDNWAVWYAEYIHNQLNDTCT